MASTRRTLEQIFFDTYNKVGKQMEISPTQYANLIVNNIEDGKKKVGYMKITASMLKGAKRVLERGKEAEEEAKMELGQMISHRFNKRKSEQKPETEIPKRSKGRPKKYESDEERKMNKRVSSVNSANKTKLKKELDLIGSDYNLDTHPLDQVISILLENPTQFSTKAVNLAKKIQPYLKEPKSVAPTEQRPKVSKEKPIKQPKEPKPPKEPKQPRRKFESEEERKAYRKMSAKNSANKTKLKKMLKPYNINISKDGRSSGTDGDAVKDGLSINEAVSYIIQRPEHFNTGIVNLAKRIEVYLKPEKVGNGIKEDALKNYGMFLTHLQSHIIDPKEPIDPKDYLQSNKIIKAIKKIKGGEIPDYKDLNWGSLTKQFKAFKSSHPTINTLEKFAKYIIGNKDEFQDKTIKRANFYLNVILGKGLDSSSSDSSSSDSDSDSDYDGESENSVLCSEGANTGFGINLEKRQGSLLSIKSPKAINKILKNTSGKTRPIGRDIISTNSIMPKFEKGSKEMKDHMAKLREMKGKGVKGSKSKTHKGDLDYTTKKGDKYYHIEHHLVEGNPYEEGGAVMLPTGHLANKLDLSSYMPRDFNRGLLSTSRMKVPMSRTPRVINAGGIKPPPMLNSSRQRYEGVEDSSKLGTAGNMSFRSLMSL